VLALQRLFSPKPKMMLVLKEARSRLVDMGCCARVVNVLGQFLPVADSLSHNLVAQASCSALDLFGTRLRMLA